MDGKTRMEVDKVDMSLGIYALLTFTYVPRTAGKPSASNGPSV